MSGRLPALFDPASMYSQFNAGFYPEDNLRGFFLRRRDQALAGQSRATSPTAGTAAAIAETSGHGAPGGAAAAPRQPRERVSLETVYSYVVSPERIVIGSPVRVFHQLEHRQHEDRLTFWVEDLAETITQCRFFLLNRRLLELFQPDFPELFGSGDTLSAEQIELILQRVLDSRTLRENRSVAQKLARRAMLDIRCHQGVGRHSLNVPAGSPFLEADTWGVVAVPETHAV